MRGSHWSWRCSTLNFSSLLSTFSSLPFSYLPLPSTFCHLLVSSLLFLLLFFSHNASELPFLSSLILYLISSFPLSSLPLSCLAFYLSASSSPLHISTLLFPFLISSFLLLFFLFPSHLFPSHFPFCPLALSLTFLSSLLFPSPFLRSALFPFPFFSSHICPPHSSMSSVLISLSLLSGHLSFQFPSAFLFLPLYLFPCLSFDVPHL